ncbi:hypothetical protein [Elizabethkingia meningoseptica]|uniref:hypothetical protein n=1 Tax=Elizabethkingia meningoseptica TaxID=238 RepID=UPI00293C6746|nr:hypothetical protein [Elizabethkingia anophelis]
MENKLIPVTEFTLQKCKFLETESNDDLKLNMESHFALLSIRRYAQFLKQPLALWMFVPCDEDGKPLEEPKNYGIWIDLHNSSGSTMGFEDHEKYLEAKERVLFENAIKIDRSPYKCTKRLLIDLAVDTPFRIYTELRYPDGNIERNEFPNPKKPNMTIEDLIEYNLNLTETAIKQIYTN